MAEWIEREYITEDGEVGTVRALVTSPVQLARLTRRRRMAARGGHDEVTSAAPARTLEELKARVAANNLLIRGLELQQHEILTRQEEDRNGTTARKELQRLAELAQVNDPTLSASEAMERAVEENPGLYREYSLKMAAPAGARPDGEAAGAARGTAATAEVLRLAKAEQAKDGTLSLADATARVFRFQPDLYERYTAETAFKV